MKLEIFVTATTPVTSIAHDFPAGDHDKLLSADEKNGVVTFQIGGDVLPDYQVFWIEQQKSLGKIERVETA
uniref:Uncharacterized protein n=1 Tax=Thermosporothrix sp. COM3 TaxID=2490863 RepID=A0A455SIX7_9CHLR|nr:hypothetical protein KTC_16330 [Thermosporothrix sp. COM3]